MSDFVAAFKASLSQGERSGVLECRFSEFGEVITAAKEARLVIAGMEPKHKTGTYLIRWHCLDAAQRDLFTEVK